jgi:decaprenylphospho-beta-D-ribofuranose 2-oxidase
VDLPAAVLNPWGIAAFNSAYYHRIPRVGRTRTTLVERFLYPLDALLDWNRLYGRRGLYQFQCVIPDQAARPGIHRLLEEIARAASFLAVLKTLGGNGRGLISFPLRGYTLALDFPHRAGTQDLLSRLATITSDHGGRVYLAKDACLPRQIFEAMYPRLAEFRRVIEDIDPEGRMTPSGPSTARPARPSR